jgi:hypothetical protein
MNEGAKQAVNYILIPIIMALVAVCYRGVSRFNRRIDIVHQMERAIDTSRDINPDFPEEDIQSKAIQIINSNIIIDNHSVGFDYSDDPIPPDREDFKEIGEIPKFPQRSPDDMEKWDIKEEIPQDKQMVRFMDSPAPIIDISVWDPTYSEESSFSSQFLSKEDQAISETISSFFEGEFINGNTEYNK